MTIKQRILKQTKHARSQARAAVVSKEEQRLFHERYDAAERVKRSIQKRKRELKAPTTVS